jgi:hypothetical protein
MKRSLKSYRSRRHARNGATLLDVATGSMLLAVLLIPSMKLISDSQSSSRRLHNRDTMLFEAEQLIESTRVLLAEPAVFNAALATPTDVFATITVTDGPDLASRVRVAADTSLPTARLLSITVDVWIDTDGDSRMDTDELSETLRTQWAAP